MKNFPKFVEKSMAVLCFGLALTANQSEARRAFFDEPDESIISSDEATKKEVERIRKLAPSKSPALNQEELRQAKGFAEIYSSFPERIAQLQSLSPDTAKVQIQKVLPELSKAVVACNQQSVKEYVLDIRRQLVQLGVPGFDGFPSYSIPNQSISSKQEAVISDVHDFLELEVAKICEKFKNAEDFENISAKVKEVLETGIEQLSQSLLRLKQQAPRAKELAQTWEKYRELLQKSIEDQTAPVSKIAGQLTWIIGVFCSFSILLFISLKFFAPDIQLELVFNCINNSI